MYTKILLPLDGSPTAESVLPMARSLAASLTVPVELLGVVETTSAAGPPDAHKPWYLSKFIDDARHVREAYLRRVAGHCFPEEITVSVSEGDPADVIVDRAAADPGSLLAIATHGRSGINRWLLGSVTVKLLSAIRNPLLVVRATPEIHAAQSEISALVVPLDGSPVAEKILPHVIFLATLLNLEVHLIRVFTLPTDSYLALDGLMVPSAMQVGPSMHDESQSYLESKAQDLQDAGVARVYTTVSEGDPASEIIDTATMIDQALIAMSTHGRSGIGRWMMGSVTEKVIRYGKNPVLVIRPE